MGRRQRASQKRRREEKLIDLLLMKQQEKPTRFNGPNWFGGYKKVKRTFSKITIDADPADNKKPQGRSS